MHWVRFCNNGAAAAAAGEFLDLAVGGRTVGYLKPRRESGLGSEGTAGQRRAPRGCSLHTGAERDGSYVARGA